MREDKTCIQAREHLNNQHIYSTVSGEREGREPFDDVPCAMIPALEQSIIIDVFYFLMKKTINSIQQR
jgi:hypothetical protein